MTASLIAEQRFEVEAGVMKVPFFAALAMLCVAVLAGYFPARRASQVDPVVALA